MGKGKRFLILGCLGTIAAFFLVLGFGYYYAVKPVIIEVLAPVPHPEANFYARFWIPTEQDPSHLILQNVLGQYMQTQAQTNRNIQSIDNEDIQQVEEFVPKMIPLVFEINKFSEEIGYTIQVQAAGYGNMQRFAWNMVYNGAEDQEKREYRGYKMLEIEGGDWLSYVDGTFFFSKTPTGLEKSLDLLKQPQSNSEELSYPQGLTKDSPLRDIDIAGSFYGFSDEPLFLWLASYFQNASLLEPDLSNYKRMAWSLNFIDETTAQLDFQLYAQPSPEIEAYLRDLINQIKSDTQTDWQLLIIQEDANGYNVQATIHDFDRIINHIFEEIAKDPTL